MERRLLWAIMNPAMIATYVFGILLAVTPRALSIGATGGSMGSWRWLPH